MTSDILFAEGPLGSLAIGTRSLPFDLQAEYAHVLTGNSVMVATFQGAIIWGSLVRESQATDWRP